MSPTTITKEECISQALSYLSLADKERLRWNSAAGENATAAATMALTYATLAGVVPTEKETS